MLLQLVSVIALVLVQVVVQVLEEEEHFVALQVVDTIDHFLLAQL